MARCAKQLHHFTCDVCLYPITTLAIHYRKELLCGQEVTASVWESEAKPSILHFAISRGDDLAVVATANFRDNPSSKLWTCYIFLFKSKWYLCVLWSFNKDDEKRIEAFEKDAYMTRTSWNENVTNEPVLENIMNSKGLLNIIHQLRLTLSLSDALPNNVVIYGPTQISVPDGLSMIFFQSTVLNHLAFFSLSTTASSTADLSSLYDVFQSFSSNYMTK